MSYNQSAPLTVVVFRRWKDTGDVLALFPYDDEGNGKCSSYQHVGQHGAANYNLVIKATTAARAAKSQDVRDLANELTSAPHNYHLKPLFHADILRGRK
jgi:hypothetical protein